MVYVTIEHTYNLIHKEYNGSITIDDIFKGAEETIIIGQKTGYSKLLVDFTTVEPNVNHRDVQRFAYYLNRSDSFLPLHIAIIADTPLKTAMSLLFKEFMRRQSNIEVYSSHQNALDWMIL